jgi:hypothetical protein
MLFLYCLFPSRTPLLSRLMELYQIIKILIILFLILVIFIKRLHLFRLPGTPMVYSSPLMNFILVNSMRSCTVCFGQAAGFTPLSRIRIQIHRDQHFFRCRIHIRVLRFCFNFVDINIVMRFQKKKTRITVTFKQLRMKWNPDPGSVFNIFEKGSMSWIGK